MNVQHLLDIFVMFRYLFFKMCSLFVSEVLANLTIKELF